MFYLFPQTTLGRATMISRLDLRNSLLPGLPVSCLPSPSASTILIQWPGWSSKNVCQIVSFPCSKPPKSCHVAQNKSQRPLRTYTTWSPVMSLTLPPTAFHLTLLSPHWPSCSLPIPGRLLFQGTRTCSSLCLEWSFSRRAHASLPSLLQGCLSGPPYWKLPHPIPDFPLLILCFISLHGTYYWPVHHIICLFVLFSTSSHYKCKNHKGQNLYLFYLVMYLQRL